MLFAMRWGGAEVVLTNGSGWFDVELPHSIPVEQQKT